MSKSVFIILLFFVAEFTQAKVKISTSGGNPNASSMLEVESTSKGIFTSSNDNCPAECHSKSGRVPIDIRHDYLPMGH